MFYIVIKALLTGAVVVAVSEIAKKSSLLAAILASLPLTSILALIWLYLDTKDTAQIKNLSYGIFWMVLPSLFFFLLLPVFLKNGFRFYSALLMSCVSTAVIYWGYVQLLKRFGVTVG